jgi:hypothetical protein
VHRIALAALTALALLAVVIEPASAASRKPLKPKLGHTVLLRPGSGTVLVKPRGKRQFKLKRATLVPLGSRVDTSKGLVKLTSAVNSKRNQSGDFSQGAFIVTQRKSDGLTDLALTGGDFGVCSAAHAAGKPLSAAANKRRRLFGRAHGRFRTRGRNSSATVRGTEWLTEDRCTGTVTKNESPNTTSKIETTGQQGLQFDLDPGQTITYYCNKLNLDPDMYCLILLAQPADGVIAGGILTQIDVPNYYLYVRAPNGQEGAVQIPFSERNELGFRQSIFACPVRQVGTFNVGWSLDGQNLLYPETLSLKLDVEGPNENCITDPPTEQPIAKQLRRLTLH